MSEEKQTANPEVENLVGGVEESAVYLYGRAKPRIDGKGRMSFPKQLQKQLGSDERRIVVTKGGGRDGFRHLWAFPMSEWKKLLRQISRMGYSSKADFLREKLLEPAQDCDIDASGRILLNEELRAYARVDLDKGGKLVVAGYGNKFMIWEESVHEKFKAREGYAGSVADVMEELGI